MANLKEMDHGSLRDLSDLLFECQDTYKNEMAIDEKKSIEKMRQFIKKRLKRLNNNQTIKTLILVSVE